MRFDLTFLKIILTYINKSLYSSLQSNNNIINLSTIRGEYLWTWKKYARQQKRQEKNTCTNVI